MADVLVVAAHPDDEVLGLGGSLLRHVEEGDTVHVHLACMDGLRDHHQRTEDAAAVAAHLGTTLSFGYLAERWSDPRSATEMVEDLVREHRPRLIYTHHPGDLNAAHRALTEGVAVASRPASDVREVRWFETPSSTEWGITAPFVPNLYVEIDWARKAEVLALYASELRDAPHPRSIDRIGDLARVRGAAAGFDAAEAFQVAVKRW